jgi:hypothetical protein
MTPQSVRAPERIVSWWARTEYLRAATLPTNPHPPVQFVKINRSGQHQQTRRYQILTSPGGAREPGTGDGSGAFDADVVAAMRYLAEMINQGLEFGPFGG